MKFNLFHRKKRNNNNSGLCNNKEVKLKRRQSLQTIFCESSDDIFTELRSILDGGNNYINLPFFDLDSSEQSRFATTIQEEGTNLVLLSFYSQRERCSLRKATIPTFVFRGAFKIAFLSINVYFGERSLTSLAKAAEVSETLRALYLEFHFGADLRNEFKKSGLCDLISSSLIKRLKFFGLKYFALEDNFLFSLASVLKDQNQTLENEPNLLWIKNVYEPKIKAIFHDLSERDIYRGVSFRGEPCVSFDNVYKSRSFRKETKTSVTKIYESYEKDAICPIFCLGA